MPAAVTPETNPSLLFSAHFGPSFIPDWFLSHTSDVGNLEINYTQPLPSTPNRKHSGTPQDYIVKFKNGALIEGDAKQFSVDGSAATYVTSDWSDEDFIHSVTNLGGRPTYYALQYMTFGLRYIFRRNYFVHPGGYFDESYDLDVKFPHGSASNRSSRFNRSYWPDGVLRIAKIIQQVRHGGPYVLLEEPELGLEPRVLKRLFDFLYWLGTPDSETEGTPQTVKDIEVDYQTFLQGIKDDIDENHPDNHRTWPDWRSERQYFIASHSNALLSKFLEHQDVTSIYEFSLDFPTLSSKTLPPSRRVSKVRKVDSYPHSVLERLGASGADILQCNGVVWVEGPSDVVYIKAWLEMFAKENGKPRFVQGLHYEFQMFGGTLLDSLCLQAQSGDPDEESRKLVEMFSFSRNAYVVLDSDTAKSEEGKIFDKSNFSKAKAYIKTQFEGKIVEGYKLGLWFAEGDIELRTIEEYLDEDSLKIGSSSKKKVAAQNRVAEWDNKNLNDFHPALKNEIELLYEKISSWQV